GTNVSEVATRYRKWLRKKNLRAFTPCLAGGFLLSSLRKPVEAASPPRTAVGMPSGSCQRSLKRAGKPASPRRPEPSPDHRADGDESVLLPGQDVSELVLPQHLRQAISRIAWRDEACREDHRAHHLPGGGSGNRPL